MKKHALASGIQGTTNFITGNVQLMQHIDPERVGSQRTDNQSSRRTNEIKEKKLIIGDKPKANASHGFLLLFVNTFYNLFWISFPKL